jgi:periplasmic divalent cation tolerance protein
MVQCSFPDEELALSAARRLVDEGLAACAQLLPGPIHSIYRWQGELCQEREHLLLLKTSMGAWPRLRERVAELHPYEVPEILALPALGNEPYLRWVEESCSGAPPADGESAALEP